MLLGIVFVFQQPIKVTVQQGDLFVCLSPFLSPRVRQFIHPVVRSECQFETGSGSRLDKAIDVVQEKREEAYAC
ncbi:hypothetical protein [Candidatus Poriferisodalis sp.]|uniref:hypothetical protein n=1 Tax=Candidatus Poriferisodalis sp. TaxID=3101277 RepID=UPI003B59E3E4